MRQNHLLKASSLAVFLIKLSVILFIILLIDLSYSYQNIRKDIASAAQRQQITNVHIKDPLLGWKPKPGSRGHHKVTDSFDVFYDIDEHGYKKTPYHSGADINIYIFGGSYTFAHGVGNSETFSNILAADYFTEKVNVFNLGVMAYGFVQMYQHFLSIENTIKKNDLILFTPTSACFAMNHKNTAVKGLLFTGTLPIDYFPRFINGRIVPVKINNFWNRIIFISMNAPLAGKLFNWYQRHIQKQDHLAEPMEIIRLIKKRTELKGGKFALIILPMLGELDRSKYNLDIASIDYFDIRSYFFSPTKHLYQYFIPVDGHYTQAGNKLTAGAIAKTLRDNHIIEQKYFR